MVAQSSKLERSVNDASVKLIEVPDGLVINIPGDTRAVWVGLLVLLTLLFGALAFGALLWTAIVAGVPALHWFSLLLASVTLCFISLSFMVIIVALRAILPLTITFDIDARECTLKRPLIGNRTLVWNAGSRIGIYPTACSGRKWRKATWTSGVCFVTGSGKVNYLFTSQQLYASADEAVQGLANHGAKLAAYLGLPTVILKARLGPSGMIVR